MATCVSLIYNAFAISIAERTKAVRAAVSIGASKRQIRGAVVFALLIAALGVPLGIAFGIGGTALVLGALAPSIEKVAGSGPATSRSRSSSIPPRSPWSSSSRWRPFASVWLPHAAQAPCAPSKPSKTPGDPRGEAFAHRRARSGRAVGELADRPASRVRRARPHGAREPQAWTWKGRAASISLGLAVILLITAGSATMYLTLGTRYIGSNDYDISAHFMSEGGLSEQTCASA